MPAKPTRSKAKAKAADSTNLLIGAHVSTAGGIETAFDRAETLAINTFQLFVKSNKQWFAKNWDEDAVGKFKERRGNWKGTGPLVAHASYLLNLASSDPEIQERSRQSFKAELERTNALGIEYLVFHPGAHMGAGEEQAIENIIRGLNWIHANTPNCQTQSVVEITAGQGTSVGHKFEHLAQILSRTDEPARMGVCIDTCHMFAAGYDIRTPESWTNTWNTFDATVGFKFLRCIHVNDSKKGLNSHVDRHEQLGQGEIGVEAFRLLMTDTRFDTIPKILETPKDEKMTEDFVNLKLLRSFHQKKK